MRCHGVLALISWMAASASNGAAAEDWDSFRAKMGASDDTVAISERLALLLSAGNKKDLGDLADDVRHDVDDRYLRLVSDGYGLEAVPNQNEMEYFNALVVHVTGLGVFADAQGTRSALESLGACETAGILVRNLVLQVSHADKQARTEKGRIFIDGTNNDERYAAALARCQVVRRQKLTPAAVGYSQTACLASRQHDCPEVADR